MDVLGKNLCLSFLLRILLVFYSLLHDSLSLVKYTDVDYFVFSDSTNFVSQGESPYRRDTYRYTPLLSWALLPNVYIHQIWGKLLFVTCDILAAVLIFKLLKKNGSSYNTAVFCVQLWLYNPLTMTVSSRGNAESIMAVLVIATLYFLMDKKHKHSEIAGYSIFALSVHMKIYPITYSLPFYLYLKQPGGYSASSVYDLIKHYLWPNKERLKLVLTFLLVLVTTTGLCYYMYGMEFIEETYLYHITRRDTRHNFSVYFYLLYLTGEASYSKVLGLLMFLPQNTSPGLHLLYMTGEASYSKVLALLMFLPQPSQAVILLAASFKYHQDLPFCCFLHTFVFVTFNKVCTSQYFLWYICLLPLIVPKLRLSKKESYSCVVFWLLGQVVWLAPAYYLEFEGFNTFLYIWCAGLVFFTMNIAILCLLVCRYDSQLQNKLEPFTLNSLLGSESHHKIKSS